MFFSGDTTAKNGQFPSSADWLWKVNLFVQVEASLLVGMFGRMLALGVPKAEALLTAFARYRARFVGERQIDFDRAFTLSDLYCGAWTGDPVQYGLYPCEECGSTYLSSLGSSGGGERYCPFCRLLARYATDPRAGDFLVNMRRTPTECQGQPRLAVEKQHAYEIGRLCRSFGARVRTVLHLTGLPRSTVVSHFFRFDDSSRCGRHPSSSRWLKNANLFGRVETAFLLSTFDRLVERNVRKEQALLTAFGEYQRRFGSAAEIDFNRAFDLVSLCWGIWAETEQVISLQQCDVCHSHHVVLLDAPAEEQHGCPFCELVERFPRDGRVRERFTASRRATQAVLA